MEHGQVLKVGANDVDFGRGWQYFYTRMTKNGLIRHSNISAFNFARGKTIAYRIPFGLTLEPHNKSN